MQDRKVWKLFNLLNNSEKAAFTRWLYFELGDRQQYVQKLYASMLEVPSQERDLENLWPFLYPDVAYDDARMRKLCRDLSKQFEQFLAFRSFRNNTQKQEVAFLQALNQREASDLFLKSSRKLKRKAEGIIGKDADYYRYLYEIEIEIQRYLSKYQRNSAEREKLFPDQYEYMLSYFDTWWAEEKLQLALGKNKPGSPGGDASKELLLEELIQELQTAEQWQENDRLQVYVQLFKLLNTQEAETNPDILVNLIRHTQEQWTEEELRNFLTALINAYIRKLNEKGEQDIALTLFSLFEWGIESRLFFIDNNLPEIVYKNLINICLRTKYFEQAKKYLENLKELLPASRQEECYRFNLGRFYFFTQSYKEVSTSLAEQAFSNIFDEIDARTLLLQAKYEISSKEPEWMVRQLNTLIRFVKYQELPAHGKEAMISGFKIFKKLILCYSSYDYEQVKNLIQKTKPLYRAAWLLEKAEEKIKNNMMTN